MSNSVLEQALLEAKQLEEAVKSNAKEILSSSMKEEIEELVKESLNEGPDDMELEVDMDDEDMVDTDDIDMDVDDSETEDEIEDAGMDVMAIEPDSEEDIEMDVEPLDLTGASDDQVLKVFKAMGSDDGVIVTQDDDVVTIDDQETGAEYKIELGNDTAEGIGLPGDMSMEIGVEPDEVEDIPVAVEEDIYEITLDEDEMGDEELPEADMETPKEKDEGEMDVEEASRTKSLAFQHMAGQRNVGQAKRRNESIRRKKPMRKPANATRKITEDYNRLVTDITKQNKSVKKQNELVKKLKLENKKYKIKNDEYKKALGMFREKINEVAVFNANLAYTTKIFTEHSTSKKEKINILRRFDEADTLKESKSLYTQIKSELNSNTKKLTESVESKITRTPSKGSSVKLLETKSYVNPQISRMKEIMSKL